MLNGKVTLKIKEGPEGGEITGDIELKFENEKIIFDKIQFTEPGTYIIEVICDNGEISNTEFTIKVEDEEVISQDDSDKVEESVEDGNRPIISQIFQPSITLEPMEMEQSENEDDTTDVVSNAGFTPFVWYNGYQLRPADVKSFKLYFSNYIPACNITFIDTTGTIDNDKNMPKNDDTFEIFLNSGSELIKSIHLRFKILKNKKNNNGTNSFVGILDIDIYKEGFKSYRGTSFEILKQIAKESNLGFNSNISNTEDKMIWRQSKMPLYEFMPYIVSRSYISDQTFLQGYIDFYWCYNYVDIEKEWGRDISKDVGIDSQGVSGKPGDDIDKLKPLIFTNDQSMNSTSFYFKESNLKNNSTDKTTFSGTKTVIKYYDEKTKSFLQFDIDSQKTNSENIEVLEGKTHEHDEENVIYEYRGKIDTDNVHKNYHYAIELNKRNYKNLSNVSINMELPQPNFNVYLYQKIRLDFIKQNPKMEDDSDKEKSTPKIVNQRLSGEWIITNITYSFNGRTLTQNIVAIRKELGKTEEEIKNQQTENKDKENNEVNENKPPESDNTIYFVGDQFIVVDKDKKYKLTIKEVPDNKEVVIADIELIEDNSTF